ncbi:Uncharacterized protein DAT39_007752 [Clarias magur]|uniref:Uncharacterized protein n=1 Tax=Clarias magur TaxID=1594786 RepID=A0A8J4X588_CLAMG|nr:Uncharacterized protein DAT39_007752 [Clarias magur]
MAIPSRSPLLIVIQPGEEDTGVSPHKPATGPPVSLSTSVALWRGNMGVKEGKVAVVLSHRSKNKSSKVAALDLLMSWKERERTVFLTQASTCL